MRKTVSRNDPRIKKAKPDEAGTSSSRPPKVLSETDTLSKKTEQALIRLEKLEKKIATLTVSVQALEAFREAHTEVHNTALPDHLKTERALEALMEYSKRPTEVRVPPIEVPGSQINVDVDVERREWDFDIKRDPRGLITRVHASPKD